MEMGRIQNSQDNLKKNKVIGLTLTYFKLHYKAVIETVVHYEQTNKSMEVNTESRNSQFSVYLMTCFLTKVPGQIKREKKVFSINGTGTMEYVCANSEL